MPSEHEDASKQHKGEKRRPKAIPQVLDLGDAGIKTLERLLGARLDEVGQILCGRQPEAEWSPGPSTEVAYNQLEAPNNGD